MGREEIKPDLTMQSGCIEVDYAGSCAGLGGALVSTLREGGCL